MSEITNQDIIVCRAVNERIIKDNYINEKISIHYRERQTNEEGLYSWEVFKRKQGHNFLKKNCFLDKAMIEFKSLPIRKRGRKK